MISERSITPKTRVRARSIARLTRGEKELPVPEPDLGFGRMDVDVDFAEGDFDEEKRLGGKPLFREAGKSLVEGGREDFILDRAPVDEKHLSASIRPPVRRPRRESGDTERTVEEVHLHQFFEDVLPEELKQPFPEAPDGRTIQDGPGAVPDGQSQPGMGEGDVREHLDDQPELGGIAAEKLFPGREVIKKVADFDFRPFRKSELLDSDRSIGFAFNERAGTVAPLGRAKQKAGNSRDRGQRFSPETEGGDREQVLLPGDFARGVADQGQGGVGPAHPTTVVPDAKERLSAGDEVDGDRRRPGVQGVFDKFLDDGYRPLDDFAGGDFPGERLRQDGDAVHGRRPSLSHISPVVERSPTASIRTRTGAPSGAPASGTTTSR